MNQAMRHCRDDWHVKPQITDDADGTAQHVRPSRRVERLARSVCTPDQLARTGAGGPARVVTRIDVRRGQDARA